MRKKNPGGNQTQEPNARVARQEKGAKSPSAAVPQQSGKAKHGERKDT